MPDKWREGAGYLQITTTGGKGGDFLPLPTPAPTWCVEQTGWRGGHGFWQALLEGRQCQGRVPVDLLHRACCSELSQIGIPTMSSTSGKEGKMTAAFYYYQIPTISVIPGRRKKNFILGSGGWGVGWLLHSAPCPHPHLPFRQTCCPPPTMPAFTGGGRKGSLAGSWRLPPPMGATTCHLPAPRRLEKGGGMAVLVVV